MSPRHPQPRWNPEPTPDRRFPGGSICTECGRYWVRHLYIRTSRPMPPLCPRCQDRAHQARARAIRAARLAEARATPDAVSEQQRLRLASGPCTYCGEPSSQADHIRPISRGGPDTADNLVPACQTCNNDKRAKLLTEWHPDRVTYAAARSPKIVAEFERLRQEAAPRSH